MLRFLLRPTSFAGIALLMLPMISLSAQACMPLPPPGMTVRISEESALIIWDNEQKIEHFIRRARFDANATDLGFLVPTPSLPTLHEANNGLFSELQTPMRPETRELEDNSPQFYSLFLPAPLRARAMAGGGIMSKGARQQITLLAEQTVGDYDAAILKAGDAASLNRWLGRNGYPSNETLTNWLRPYIEKGWIVTAFKIRRTAHGDASRPLGLAPVRMSFATPRPFYPYREPPTTATGSAPPRSLRLFLLADEGRMAATLGENGPVWGTENVQNVYRQHSSVDAAPSAIPGHVGVEWAGVPQTAFFAPNVRDYAGLPSSNRIPGHLTVFLDTQSPRPGTDELYFTPAADQSDLKPEPLREYVRRPFLSIPVEPFLVTLLVGGLWWRRHNFRAKSW